MCLCSCVNLDLSYRLHLNVLCVHCPYPYVVICFFLVCVPLQLLWFELNKLMSDHPNASGAPLGESLWKLPNRRFHPEYYFTITKPISMAQIRNKLKKGDYANITDLTADLYLMIDNAKKAFPSTHKVHRDAVKMQKVLNMKVVDVSGDEESDGDEEESTTNSSTQSLTKKKPKPKVTSTSPANSMLNVSSNSLNVNTGNSPKCKFPNNPMLKKKLLNLQKFLSEYTVN